MSMLSIRGFPFDVTSYSGERVHKRCVQGSFVEANMVLKGVPEKKIRHLQNGARGAIVKLWLFFTLKLMGNGFVRSMA